MVNILSTNILLANTKCSPKAQHENKSLTPHEITSFILPFALFILSSHNNWNKQKLHKMSTSSRTGIHRFSGTGGERHRGVSNLSRTGESGSGRQHLC